MATYVVATDYQIGVDKAMIQVPQNYTVPANPPYLLSGNPTSNPPTNAAAVPNPNGTSQDTVTVYVSAILGFSKNLVLSYFIQRIDSSVDSTISTIDQTTVPPNGANLPIKIGITPASMNAASPTWVTTDPSTGAGGWTGYIVGATGSGTFSLTPNSSDSLHTYLAENFISLYINPGDVGGTPLDPNHPPSYKVNLYVSDTSVTPHTYAACSFTLVVMPSQAEYGLGSLVYTMNDNTIQALTKDAAIGDTSVTVASTLGYSVSDYVYLYGVTETPEVLKIASIDTIANVITFMTALQYAHPTVDGASIEWMAYLYGSAASLTIPAPTNGTASSPVSVWVHFYPIEAKNQLTIPNPLTITLTVDGVLLEGASTTYPPMTFIDGTASSIGPYLFKNYKNQLNAVEAGETRTPAIDLSGDVGLDIAVSNPTGDYTQTGRATVKVTGTDVNGVSTSIYILVTAPPKVS